MEHFSFTLKDAAACSSTCINYQEVVINSSVIDFSHGGWCQIIAL